MPPLYCAKMMAYPNFTFERWRRSSERSDFMDNMIKMILDMDKKAREITEEAEESKIRTLQNIPLKKDEIRNKYLQRARLRIQKNAEQERRVAEERWRTIRSEHEKILHRLDEDYQKNYEAWVDQIVNRVVGE